jgi:RNA-splicing ligase RtcB
LRLLRLSSASRKVLFFKQTMIDPIEKPRFHRENDLQQQMQGVWFDPRLRQHLREESPKSYKDIRAVMRVQRDLVKITRTLVPLLVYKGAG